AIALCRYKDTELVNSINITAFESLPGCLLVNNLLKLDLLLDVNVILCRLGYSIDDIEKMGTFSSLRDGDFATALLASMMLHFLHRSSEPPLPNWTMPEELRKKAGVLNPKDMYGRADHRHEANHEATMWGRKFRRDEYHGHKIPDKPYQSTRPFRHHSQKQFGV
ncbi:MAG: hypothetical protein Q4D81_14920, partial [Eubacteriales bacterium]|nr:hypothetical protein [Eubacteriales bacterium]